jgi:hypothetical protein
MGSPHQRTTISRHRKDQSGDIHTRAASISLNQEASQRNSPGEDPPLTSATDLDHGDVTSQADSSEEVDEEDDNERESGEDAPRRARSRPGVGQPVNTRGHKRHRSSVQITTIGEKSIVSASPVDQTGDDPSTWIEARLNEAVLPLSSQLDVTEVVKARSRFTEMLQKLKITGSKSNSQSVLSFRPSEIVEVVNFVFSDLIGPKARDRLSGLVEKYNTKESESSGIRTAARADRAVIDAKTPDPFRRFFGAYSKAAGKGHAEDSLLHHVHQIHNDLEFLKEYDALKRQAEDKDPALKGLLAKCGYHTKPGWTVVTCLIHYVTETLGMSRSQLSNFVQAIQSVDNLVQEFTRGIIVLLPPGCSSR